MRSGKTNSTGSKGQRPRLELPRTRLEITLEFFAAAGVSLGLYLLFTMYSQLPERIPVHFDFSGRPDSWGGKETLWFLGAIMVVMYGAMTLICRVPHLFNYPWSITAENAERQYRIARTFLTLLKTEIIWFFALLIYETIEVGMGEAGQMPPTTLYTFIVLLAVSVIGFFVLSYRSR
jgi:uncharacterized membrane protein